jgi:hypothetical protein
MIYRALFLTLANLVAILVLPVAAGLAVAAQAMAA